MSERYPARLPQLLVLFAEHLKQTNNHDLPRALTQLLSAIRDADEEAYESERVGEYLMVLPQLHTEIGPSGMPDAFWTFRVVGRDSDTKYAVLAIASFQVRGDILEYGCFWSLLEAHLNPPMTLRESLIAALDTDRSVDEEPVQCRWCQQNHLTMSEAVEHLRSEHCYDEASRQDRARAELERS